MVFKLMASIVCMVNSVCEGRLVSHECHVIGRDTCTCMHTQQYSFYGEIFYKQLGCNRNAGFHDFNVPSWHGSEVPRGLLLFS